jgi:opine dehydrogenase
MVSIAVLGAGNAGCSLAGEMTLLGFDVSLAELPEYKSNLEVPMKKGGIQVTGELKNGFAKVKKMTFDIKDAVQGRDLIFITSPAFGHEAFTRACAPHLKQGQALIYISYFGALRMRKLLNSLGVNAEKVTTAETASFIYACDRVGKKGAFFMDKYNDDAKVVIKRDKDKLPFAAFPATKTKEILSKVNELLPSVVEAANVFETSINNVNPISHPAGVILNAGWIEHTGGKFSFYLEGQTPSIKKVAKAMDQEKMAVAASLGLKKISNQEWSKILYAKYADQKTGNVHQEKYYKNVYDAPPNLKHRYLTEDVIYGLVPMCSIAKVADIPTPAFSSIITLASIANEVDYWQEGMTLDKLDLQGKTIEQMLTFVNTGH